jgi:hypothetical protein
MGIHTLWYLNMAGWKKKNNQMDVYGWENHQTTWWVFQDATFDYGRVDVGYDGDVSCGHNLAWMVLICWW